MLDDDGRAALRDAASVLEVERRRGEFRRTKNPLHAWFALLEALDGGEAIPDWVVEYLRDAASKLRDLCVDFPTGQGWRPRGVGRLPAPDLRDNAPAAVAPAVAEALGFKKAGRAGRGNVFRMVDDERDLLLAFAVAQELKARRQRPRSRTRGAEDAYGVVAAATNTSRASVGRAWKANRTLVKTILASLRKSDL